MGQPPYRQCLTCVLSLHAANMLDTIPAPLLDRMEVLEVSGYVSEEKVAIAERYLSPQAKEASGLKDTDISLDPEAIAALIRYYCRESGVRNLKKHIDKVSCVRRQLLRLLTWLSLYRSIERQHTRSCLIWGKQRCQNRMRQKTARRDRSKHRIRTSSRPQKGYLAMSHPLQVNQVQSRRPLPSRGRR